MSYTAKSVILEITNNYGSANYLGVRSIDFYLSGSKITNIPTTNFLAYATTNLNASYIPANAFDTSKSKTGTASGTEWYSSSGQVRNQRLICVFNSVTEFDEIRINNSHSIGGSTTTGIKNLDVIISDDTITSTVFDEDIANSTVIFRGFFFEHPASDIEYEINLNLMTPPVYATDNLGVLLIHSDDIENTYVFVDSSYTSHTITRSTTDVVHSWDERKFGYSSIKVDGTGDYISVAHESDFLIGTDDFTFDAWYNLTSITEGTLFALGSYVDGMMAYIYSGQLYVYVANSFRQESVASLGISADTWFHFAVTRASGTVRIFIDGTEIGTGTSLADSISSTSGLRVGYGFDGTGNDYITGFIDEIRLVNDSAEWTTSFTPPTYQYFDSTVRWDRFNKGPELILSNNELTVSKVSNDWEQVTANLGKSSGKWYFEVIITVGTANTTVGIGNGTESLESYVGDFTTGWGYMSNSRLYNSTIIYPSPAASYTTGDIIGVAVDLDAGKIWWSKNGTWVPGIAWPSPDPATGTDAPYSNLISGTKYYPAYGPYGATEVATGVFKEEDMNYTIPVGFSSWESAPAAPTTYPIKVIEESYDLTSSLADETVLLLHSNSFNGYTTIADSSDSAHTITNSAITHSVDKVVFGNSSLKFASSGSLSAPDSDDWHFGADDFTIDFWINPTAISSRQAVINQSNTGATSVAFWIEVKIGGSIRFLTNTGGTLDFSTTGTVTAGVWTHIAVVRNGNTVTVYFNGVADVTTGDATGLTIANQAEILRIARYSGGFYFTGYIDELRIVNGLAAWTTDFTPPSSYYDIGWPTLPESLVLLIHSDTTDESVVFEDSSTFARTITPTNATHQDTEAKFGATSMYFAGAGYLKTASSSDFAFGLFDFTYDFWVNGSMVSTNEYAIDIGTNGSVISFASGKIIYYDTTSGLSSSLYTAGPTLSANTWYHVAVVRKSGVLTAYLNGVAWGNKTAHTKNFGAAVVNVAQYGGNNYRFTGYIDELRILKGVAYWTADFTPPSYPYGAIPTATVATELLWELSQDIVFSYEEEWDLREDAVIFSIFELPWEYVEFVRQTYEESYAITFPVLTTLTEPYSLSWDIVRLIEVIYGIRMLKPLVQWYGDAPIPKLRMNEYYNDAYTPIRRVAEFYNDALLPKKIINEFYGNKPVSIKVINELFGNAPYFAKDFIESYGNKPIGINRIELLYKDVPIVKRLLSERYDDARLSKKFINIPYNDSPVLKKIIRENYDDALPSKKVITENWDNSVTALSRVVQSFSISSTTVSKEFSVEYDLLVRNKIKKRYDLNYYMVSEISIEGEVNISVTVDGISIDFISIDIDAGMDKYTLLGSIEVASDVDYINSPLLGEVECIIDGVTFNFFIENRSQKKTNAGMSWTIDLVSPTAKLDSPYSKTMVASFPNGIYASDLVQQMADYQGIWVDWQIIDWAIPSYAISANDETPLQIIKKVVNAVGAIMQTKPNGDILIISQYPVSPTRWDVEVPTVVFSSETNIVSLDESITINEGYNAYLITDQGSSAADINLDVIDVDATTKIVRGYRVPFADGPFDLVTSGGLDISISKETYPIEALVPIDFDDEGLEEWEYVEFIDWVGTTQYPIYELLEWEWMADDMGAFQISENGTLTVITQSATLKESLLRIKYKTKYWEWTVRGPVERHVQFYVPEIETV